MMVSDTDLGLWVASDEEKAEVGITVNCLLTNLNHLGNGIKTRKDMMKNVRLFVLMLQRLEIDCNFLRFGNSIHIQILFDFAK